MVGGGVFVFFFQSVMHTQAGTRRRGAYTKTFVKCIYILRAIYLQDPSTLVKR